MKANNAHEKNTQEEWQRLDKRRDPTQIIKDISRHLTSEPKTINRIAKETDLNWKTVRKYVDIINTAKSIPMEVLRMENATYLKRKDLLSLSIDEQARYGGEVFFPQPEQDDIILLTLLKNPHGLILPKTEKLEELIEDGFVEEKNGKMFLTEEGRMLAKITKKMYPKLWR